LLDGDVHIRAEKSYSNVNRVICDETTSFITTSARPFTVRHTTLTITSTYWNGIIVTSTQNISSTTTEFPNAYEDVTETVTVTDLVTSPTTETTTITPTYESSELPRPTVYAACQSHNIIGGIQGYGIVGIEVLPGKTNIFAALVPNSSPQTCCEACARSTEVTRACTGSVWLQNECYHIISGDQCNGAADNIGFYLSRDRELAASEGMLLSNGVCGQQVWLGKYCSTLGGYCAGEV